MDFLKDFVAFISFTFTVIRCKIDELRLKIRAIENSLLYFVGEIKNLLKF